VAVQWVKVGVEATVLLVVVERCAKVGVEASVVLVVVERCAKVGVEASVTCDVMITISGCWHQRWD